MVDGSHQTDVANRKENVLGLGPETAMLASVDAEVAPVIKERMMKKGSMMVGYQPLGDRVNFFRQIVTNPAVTKKDLDFFLDEIERLGRDL